MRKRTKKEVTFTIRTTAPCKVVKEIVSKFVEDEIADEVIREDQEDMVSISRVKVSDVGRR